MTDHPDPARAYAIATSGPRPTDDPFAPSPLWKPPRWVTDHSKRTLQYLVVQLAQKVQRLQCENAAMQARLSMYDAREKRNRP